MRKLLLALLLLGTLTAAAQGFISHQARLAKKQYEQKTANARARGEATDKNARMQLFVTCAKDADAREVANATKQAGAKVRVVKGNLIVLDIPYSKLEALAEVKGVEIINMPPKMSKKTDVTRQVTQAEEVIDGSAPQLPQAYTGKGVIVGIIDRGFDLTHPMFKDKDGKLRIKGYYSQGNKTLNGDSVIITFDDGQRDTLSGSAFYKPEDLLDTLKVKDVGGSHGSHCLSIAAGSILSDVKGTAGKALGGIAPEADILICNNYQSELGFNAWGGGGKYIFPAVGGRDCRKATRGKPEPELALGMARRHERCCPLLRVLLQGRQSRTDALRQQRGRIRFLYQREDKRRGHTATRPVRQLF